MPLIGQNQAERFLARTIANERVSHAFLFLGPPGSGKSTAAQLFARAVNCARQPAAVSHPRWALNPCGECPSCRYYAAGTHPELITVRPESKTGQNITIEQARELRKSALLRPRAGNRRVYWLPNAETLGEAAANALLKVIEEPPEFVLLILCAPTPAHVLPTIRSRCQLVRFGPAPRDEVVAALRERGASSEAASAIAGASANLPGLALSRLDQPALLATHRRILDLFGEAAELQTLAGSRPSLGVHAFRLAEEFRKLAATEASPPRSGGRRTGKAARDTAGQPDREEPAAPPKPVRMVHREHLEQALGLLRDVLVLVVGSPAGLVHNQDRIATLRDTACRTTPALALQNIEVVREAQQLLERNVAPQLVLERMFWALIAGPVPLIDP